MFFLQAAQTPLTVVFEDRILTIPLFTMRDVIEWGSEIAANRVAERTKGMSEPQRREHLTFYPSIPPDLSELQELVKRPEGTERVLRTCLARADVYRAVEADGKFTRGESLPRLTSDEIQSILQSNGAGRLTPTAWVLADLDDRTAAIRPPKRSDDPLAR